LRVNGGLRTEVIDSRMASTNVREDEIPDGTVARESETRAIVLPGLAASSW
jgi:hypothetical protein